MLRVRAGSTAHGDGLAVCGSPRDLHKTCQKGTEESRRNAVDDDGRGVLLEPRVDPEIVAVAAGTERQEVGVRGPRGLQMPTATDHIRPPAAVLSSVGVRATLTPPQAGHQDDRGVPLELRVDPVVVAVAVVAGVAVSATCQEVGAEGTLGL